MNYNHIARVRGCELFRKPIIVLCVMKKAHNAKKCERKTCGVAIIRVLQRTSLQEIERDDGTFYDLKLWPFI